jgi:hypothetical protein
VLSSVCLGSATTGSFHSTTAHCSANSSSVFCNCAAISPPKLRQQLDYRAYHDECQPPALLQKFGD